MNETQSQIAKLEQEVKQLLDWKQSRLSQQISYPLDPSSWQTVKIDTPIFKSNDTAVTTPVVFSQVTTSGGSATEVLTVTGVLTGDIVFVQIVNDGTNNVTIKSADATGTDQVTIVFSGNPSNDTVVNVVAYRTGVASANGYIVFEINGVEHVLPEIL